MEKSYPNPPVVIVSQLPFGDTPVQVTCPVCHTTVVTTTTSENGAAAWIAALIVLLICFPFFWVPLCIDSCSDIHHKCPNCNAHLGVYKKI
ncbi:lipopolysaccharide-induced tumor necrosis factor-alpha factor homolog [Parasteatoda tepidariorum]|uniref:lipopolysaccharide-induced tumor necrosis factor-alpha factor homolog n=1 Tax=Parasteatoda tepidariorum TaxID=114398 RepID=UPI00077F84FA|nr:lipopolysaccharide-induced tumor necrosis factor-alpha factor homolog [Parasteatoda tepidariorum]XP_042908396.1 lipopolysaccharide-induced tumor necrosis factor-alpha factor homolog [Parasteatoda tepidariorum]